MKILKIRRLGSSNVVVLPREFEALGYTPGERVLVEALPSGDVLIRRGDHVRAAMGQLAARVVEEDHEALQILADHDSGLKKGHKLRSKTE